MPDSAKPTVLLVGNVYPGTRRKMEAAYDFHALSEAADRAAKLAEVAPRCRAILTAGHGGADGALMDALPNLGIIANFGVGYDSVDVAAAKARGIRVTNTPDVLTDEVADLAMALLLATVRRVPQGDRYVRSGAWLKGPAPFTPTLIGKTMGVLGLGRIGKAIARRAEAFGVKIAYFGRSRQDVPYPYYADLTAMARDVDILMIVAPGGPETRNIVNRGVIEALGPQGTLINVARGSLVDEPALIAALKDGRLGAAGLDVFADEPRVPDGLLALQDNVVFLPHMGSATHETRGAMGDLALANIDAFLAGMPLLTEVPETR